MERAIERGGAIRAAATIVGAAELESARRGFHRAHPRRSAKRVFHFTQMLAIAGLIAAIAWAMRQHPAITFDVLHLLALAVFASAIALRFAAAANSKPLLARLAQPAHWPVYTILCPLYREANVVGDLVAAIDRLDYPKSALDVKLLVESDDAETLAAALAIAETHHVEVVIVPASAPRTKPKALNAGLALARGEYVVIYDAEDRPHPQQLLAALAAFEDGGAELACVQAPLDVDNPNSSWIARQFAAEYAILFREVLPLLARFKLPMPLGGSSNHFRTDVLRAAGGWDPYNVREKTRAFAA